jgi:hypothetical protein
VVARVVAEHGLRVRIAVPEEQAARLPARHARIVLEDRTLKADIDQVSAEPEHVTTWLSSRTTQGHRAFVVRCNRARAVSDRSGVVSQPAKFSL